MQFVRCLAVASICAAIASSQDGTTSVPMYPDLPVSGVSDHPARGKQPGTERWNITFRDHARSFDIKEFRDAVHQGAGAETVAAIVKNLELRVRQDQERFRQFVSERGGEVVIQFWLINAACIEIDPKHLDAIRAHADVLDVRPDLETYPLTPVAVPFIKTATDNSHHRADSEQARGNTGRGWTVAVVDTSQDDLANGPNKPHQTYHINGDKTNTSGPGIGGTRLLYNKAYGAQPPNNNHPHGTGVAGIAAGAQWANASGDHGHAFDANIGGYSICNTAGSCGSSFAIEAAGWQAVAADAVANKIVSGNMSYGSSPDPTDVSQMAIDACALNADVLPVTAAGNSAGSTAGSSSTANGLAVGACDNSKAVAPFSSRGPLSGDSPRYFPDIAANGVNTIMPQYGNEASNYVASGTSMASPQVCGAAALVKSANPGLNSSRQRASRGSTRSAAGSRSFGPSAVGPPSSSQAA
jgi:serine protease AprX